MKGRDLKPGLEVILDVCRFSETPVKIINLYCDSPKWPFIYQMLCILSGEKLSKVFHSTSIVLKNSITFQSYILANFYLFYIIVFFRWQLTYLLPPSDFGVSRIEPLCSPACPKRRLMEACRGFPAGLYHQWWMSKTQEPSRVAHDVATPSRNPERSSTSSPSTIFYINYFQKTTWSILTIYGAI